MLIQWTTGPHPALRLPDQGCSLVHLEGWHPQAENITDLLGSIGFQDSFSVSRQETPHLVAHIQTPRGVRRLSDRGDDHG
jgi:hypothetical protein